MHQQTLNKHRQELLRIVNHPQEHFTSDEVEVPGKILQVLYNAGFLQKLGCTRRRRVWLMMNGDKRKVREMLGD